MISLKKTGYTLLCSALLSSAMALSVMAASREKIGTINLNFDTDIRAGGSGGEVSVTASGKNQDSYYIDSVEVINDMGENWTHSNPPEVEILLEVEDEEGFYFDNQTSKSFKLNLSSSLKNCYDRVDFIKAHLQNHNSALALTVRLSFDKDADYSKTSPPSQLKWNDTTGSWSQVSSAKYYQIQLLKGSSSVGSIESTYETSYDFSHRITEPGIYQFKVRSVKSGNNTKSSWTASDFLTISEEQVRASGNTPSNPSSQYSSTGGWQQAADGIRWWWKNPDGSYPVSTWIETEGSWYYFDPQGYMQTGWIEVNGICYYLDPVTGDMYANRRTPDGFWVDETGAWVPGM